MAIPVERAKPQASGRMRAYNNAWPISLMARMGTLIVSALLFVLFSIGFYHGYMILTTPPLLITGGLTLLGLWDLLQTRQSIRRNYPILAHFRFLLEFIRPEIRQYFFESDTEAAPFSRNQRSLVYQRAKAVVDKRAFGTQRDLNLAGAEWINHSTVPKHIKNSDFRVTVGGKDCLKPYDASIFNISAMSFGALSANAILALNKGAKRGGFAHDTGEGSISPYHIQHGGDLIWEIGSGYFGCRTESGRFDPVRFAEQAKLEQVKMIEIKLSQGAKPGHGGVLPASKVTQEIAMTRGVPMGQDCVSPAAHSEFSSPIELLQFVKRLRDLSGDKPVGFKLCIGHPWEWFAICKAMLKTEILPDFIVVDGSEGGTGAAPVEFADHVGYPLQDALLLVHNTLVGIGLREEIRIIASGKIISAFDIVRTCALGADMCNSARGFMFALGCIMAQACHTGHCPTGVTTQDKHRQRALEPDNKSERVYSFHRNTLSALGELIGAAGLTHPIQIKPYHLVRRMNDQKVALFSEVYTFVKYGEILEGARPGPLFEQYWDASEAESF